MYDELFTANKRNNEPSVRDLAGRKSVDDLQMETTLEEEYQQSTRLNLERLGDNLRIAANTAERAKGVIEIIDEACKQNSSGLPW